MERDEVWRAIDTERTGVADLLDELTDEEWDRPSLCAGWTVRHVAAHLTLAPQSSLGGIIVDFARARGSFDRMVHDTAVRHATRPPSRLVAELRAGVGSRRLAPGQKVMDALLDILVHGQDITVPLRRERSMPARPALASLQHAWTRGFPFHAQRRLTGFTLVASDAPWSVGAGPVVSGPVSALVLLVTGRPAALPALTGDGVPELQSRLHAVT